MRPSSVWLTSALIAGTPVTTIALMAAAGLARPGPALVAIILVATVGICLALIWAREMTLLADTVRRAASEDMVEPALLDGTPVLPEIERIGRDIERLSRMLAARTAVVSRLSRADESIVERLPDPLIVLSAGGEVRRANAAARAAFGTDMSAVLRHPGLRAAIDRASRDETRTAQTAELTIRVPVLREVRATVVAIDTPLADGGEIVAVLSDRTRERMVERTRADFVANASHELRTPLASLIGFIDTLLGPAADDLPAQRRFLGIMADQAARMSRLIDDLLSLSRIELTEHQPPSDCVDVRDVVDGLAPGFEPTMAARNMTMVRQYADTVPNVVGDADQLAQVVQNIVDNAIKYGREGQVVRISIAPAPVGGRWPARAGVLLTVQDEGIGIPRTHLPRLTERFYRVDKGRSRTVGGTGLGLAIVRHIVTRHRGVLQFDSQEGAGTTAFVWLPTVAATGAATAASAAQATAGPAAD